MHRRFARDRAETLLVILCLLAPILFLFRMAPGGSLAFLAGMAGSVLFSTSFMAPLLTIIEEQVPPELKATSVGMNILLLNILVIGTVAPAIGVISDQLAKRDIAESWTWPLMAADAIALLALPLLWLAARNRDRNVAATGTDAKLTT